MSVQRHTFLTEKTARYFTLGDRTKKTKNIWMVCHGYGQLAENFIRKFDPVQDEENYIIAPEGLHRYYLDQEHVKVGASWMTREDRLTDIDDYVRMLDVILEKETKEFDGKIILLGFSQGVATASRWYRFGHIQPQVFIMWAGVFPPDLPMENELDAFQNSRNFVVIGNEDEFFNEERRGRILSEIRNKGIEFEAISFDGKHQLNSEILKKLKNKI